MKGFIKTTLACVLGVVLASIVITILSIVTLTGMALSSDTETIVSDNSVFVLELNGTLNEQSQENPLYELLGEEYESCGLDDILSSIRKAKENDQIKGIVLQAEAFSASFASMEEIRNALLDFKTSGKFILSYANQYYHQGTYYLASVADAIALNPEGTIGWSGLAAQPVFFKDLLAKVGVEVQVFKVGTYKSAVEPYINTQMSDANREQMTVMMQEIWGKMVADVSASRGLSADTLNYYADMPIDFSKPDEYLAMGMIDKIMFKDEFITYLKEQLGQKEDESLKTLYLKDMVNVKRSTPLDKSGNIIAVYYAAGEIVDSQPVGSEGPSIVGSKVYDDLMKLKDDENVKAVVLRVNSPGGSVYASEQINHAMKELKAKKPVVVSMGDYAASGGYYISCPADSIFADYTTLTGSIGIFGMMPSGEKLFNDKLGIHFDGIATNKHSLMQANTMGLLNKPFTAEEKNIMQAFIERGYHQFISRCAEGRKKSHEEIEAVAEGRVWTGMKALELGLVDKLGGIDEAIQAAKNMAGVENCSLLNYPEKENFLSTLFETGSKHLIQGQIKSYTGDLYQHLQMLNNLKSQNPIQARMPYYLNIY